MDVPRVAPTSGDSAPKIAAPDWPASSSARLTSTKASSRPAPARWAWRARRRRPVPTSPQISAALPAAVAASTFFVAPVTRASAPTILTSAATAGPAAAGRTAAPGTRTLPLRRRFWTPAIIERVRSGFSATNSRSTSWGSSRIVVSSSATSATPAARPASRTPSPVHSPGPRLPSTRSPPSSLTSTSFSRPSATMSSPESDAPCARTTAPRGKVRSTTRAAMATLVAWSNPATTSQRSSNATRASVATSGW